MVLQPRPKLTPPKPNRSNLPILLTISRSQSRVAFDYPVEHIRQELEDKYTTRVAQGGLSVYTTINVEAQKKAYEVVRAGLRRYDRARGWRSTYKLIPTSAEQRSSRRTQELNNYKDPDWYGNDYTEGRYLSGPGHESRPREE